MPKNFIEIRRKSRAERGCLGELCPRILHVITGLGQGGAERQLSNLVDYGRDAFKTSVFSIRPLGVMADSVKHSGASLSSGEARTPQSIGWMTPLRTAIRDHNPDLVVGWMYHGNLGATVSRMLGYRGPVVWNIRHSVQDLSQEKWGTRNVIRVGALVSAQASRIIYNSETAAAQHERLGYKKRGRVVLPNGFDVHRFEPSPFARRDLRDSLGILETDLVLGVIGRFHPMKNHLGWMKAFADLASMNRSLHCVMMGVGVDDPRGPVAQEIRKAGLSSRVHVIPPTDSPEIVYPALDILVLPSAFGEGFSNVVGEAMACGVPAAVTDVGDSPVLVGETGFVIEGTQPEDLAAGVASAIRLDQGNLAERGRRARERVINHYSLDVIGERYYAVLREALDNHGHKGCEKVGRT